MKVVDVLLGNKVYQDAIRSRYVTERTSQEHVGGVSNELVVGAWFVSHNKGGWVTEAVHAAAYGTAVSHDHQPRKVKGLMWIKRACYILPLESSSKLGQLSLVAQRAVRRRNERECAPQLGNMPQLRTRSRQPLRSGCSAVAWRLTSVPGCVIVVTVF